LFVVLATVSLWIYLHHSNSTIRKELYDFAVEDTSSINKIYMQNMSGKEIVLEKVKPGHWKVNKKYKARNDAINNLLECIKDLQVRQPVAKSAIENVSKQLATTSTMVEIFQKNKLVKKYYVGGDTQDGLGTYMLLTDIETGKNSSMPFVMFIPGFNGFLSIRYFIDEDLWRDRSIFSYYPNEISYIKVDYAHMPDSSFTISLSDRNDISIFDSKGNNLGEFDTIKAKRYITYYTNIQYERIVNNLRPTYRDSVLAKGVVHTITLKERNGAVHTVKTYSRPADPEQINPATNKPYEEDPDRMFALINNDKDMVMIQYYVFGKLFVNASWFRKPDISSGVKK
jgi:hypothetical protein